jgi:hypothetical protein
MSLEKGYNYNYEEEPACKATTLVGVMNNFHEIDKVTEQLKRTAKEDGEKEIHALAIRLSKVLEDISRIVHGDLSEEQIAKIAEKYK